MRRLIHVILAFPCSTRLLVAQQWLLGEGRMVASGQNQRFHPVKIPRDSNLGHRVAWDFDQDDFFMGIATARKLIVFDNP